jgi:tetratricopeptide (TPR) repeat protein
MVATSTIAPRASIRTKSSQDRAAGRKTVLRLNARLALLTLLGVVVLGAVLQGWHGYQVQRTARVFLKRANKLEAERNWIASAESMRCYLSLHPDDDNVRIRMTTTFDRGATTAIQRARAIDLYYQTVGRISADKKKPALHRRLTEMLLKEGRFSEAEMEAGKLLAVDAKDATTWRLLARARYGQMQSGAADGRSKSGPPFDKVLESALQTNPGDIELSAILAQFYRGKDRLLDKKGREVPRAEREKKADLIMDKMIEANPASAEAYLARYRYRARNGLAGDEEDLATALRLGPENVSVLEAAAENAYRDGIANSQKASFEQARGYYERILKIAPHEERFYVTLGKTDYRSGDVQRAVETWRHGLEQANKDSIVLHLHLADALVASAKVEDAGLMLQELDAIVARDGGKYVAADRAKLEFMRDFVRAKWWMVQGHRASALPLLKRVVNQAIDATHALQISEAWAMLGYIRETEEEWDLAALAYEQASLLNPWSAPYKLAAAKAWTNACRYDAAIKYAKLALAVDDTSETWFALTDAYYREQVRLPKSRRDWKPFNQALAEVAAAAKKGTLAKPWRMNLSQAGALLAGATDKPPDDARREAAELLRAAEREHPSSAELLRTLPLLFESAGCPAEANRAAASLGKLPNQDFQALLCRVQLCVLRKQYAAAKEALNEGLKQCPSQRLKLRFTLSELYAAEGNRKQVLQELKQLNKDFPNHLPTLCQLTELAWSLGKIEDARQWEEELRSREGEDGFYWRYYRARRLSAEIRDAESEPFHEVEKLVDELFAMRPSWPNTHLLRAEVDLRRGNLYQAIDALSNAIRLGEQRIEIYEQLVALLYGERRFAEADELLDQLQERASLSRGLSAMEIDHAARAGCMDRALSAARRGVENRPKDPMAHIWLGNILLAEGKTTEAERAIRRAVQIAPADARTHDALFLFYLRTGQGKLAARTLEDTGKKVQMLPAQSAFTLAQGYELLSKADRDGGKFAKKADEQYREAQRLDPGGLAVLEARAKFLLNRNPVAAEQVLGDMLKLDARSSIARQLLAALLASRGGEKNWRKSMELIEIPGVSMSPSEQRLQALLLMQHGEKEDLLKARAILKKLTADPQKSTPDDVILLAGLLERDHDVALARKMFLVAVGRPGVASSHLVQYITFLLRNNLDDEAGPWFEKLRQQVPDEVGICGWYVQWLHGQHRDAEIEPAIDAFAKRALDKPSNNGRPATAAPLFRELGDICTAVDQHSAAEHWYRRLLDASPQEYASLAASLGRQDRLDEAIALYAAKEKTDRSARPATALAAALSSSKLDSHRETCRRMEPVLKRALANHPKDVELLTAVAGVCVSQQRSQEAIDLYRRVLAIKHDDVQSMNNLATMLAEQPGGCKEALRLINDAIERAGRLSALLDTKGTILVQDGRAKEAVGLLKEAVSGAGTDPRFFFHLSVACQRAGDSGEARKALTKARSGNFAQQILTVSDRRLLQELERQLGM